MCGFPGFERLSSDLMQLGASEYFCSCSRCSSPYLKYPKSQISHHELLGHGFDICAVQSKELHHRKNCQTDLITRKFIDQAFGPDEWAISKRSNLRSVLISVFVCQIVGQLRIRIVSPSAAGDGIILRLW